jgi:hypothetical protein
MSDTYFVPECSGDPGVHEIAQDDGSVVVITVPAEAATVVIDALD